MSSPQAEHSGDLDRAISVLARELGDEQLARSLIDRQPDLAQRVDLLSMTPPRVAPHRVTSIIAFAFGNRLDEGHTRPGPVNEALARTVELIVREYPVPVFAQWEIADLLTVPCQSIRPERDANGEQTYLSTEGVALAALRLGMSPHGAGVVAFHDHAVRCVMTCRKHGIDAAVPDGLVLPASYDAQSGQPWTRERAAYLAIDLVSRRALG